LEIDYLEINENTQFKDTILTLAARTGQVEILETILKHSPHPDLQLKANGVTPLLVAAQEGHLEAVNALLRAGSQVNQATTDTGVTPIFMAAQSGHLDVVDFLLANGANPNVERTLPPPRLTPLLIAANKGYKPIVYSLTRSPLLNFYREVILASKSGQVEVARDLMSIWQNMKLQENCRNNNPIDDAVHVVFDPVCGLCELNSTKEERIDGSLRPGPLCTFCDQLHSYQRDRGMRSSYPLPINQ
jgi:ankyrin repeat protein